MLEELRLIGNCRDSRLAGASLSSHMAVIRSAMPIYGDEHQFTTATPREPELPFKQQGHVPPYGGRVPKRAAKCTNPSWFACQNLGLLGNRAKLLPRVSSVPERLHLGNLAAENAIGCDGRACNHLGRCAMRWSCALRWTCDLTCRRSTRLCAAGNPQLAHRPESSFRRCAGRTPWAAE